MYHLSFVSKVAAKFIGLKYEGDADVVLACGNTPNGDYTAAKRGLIFSRSHYADGAQKYKGLDAFLKLHADAGDKFEVVRDGDWIDADYRNYSHVLDAAMKRWGLLTQEQGLVDDCRLVSDTGELDFDFGRGVFRINAPQVKTASGNIKGMVELGKYRFEVKNEKMTLSLLSLDGKDTDESGHLLLVALGWCGNLGMKFEEAEGGVRILRDAGHGPVSIDALEGSLSVKAADYAGNSGCRDELPAAVGNAANVDNGMDAKRDGCDADGENGGKDSGKDGRKQRGSVYEAAAGINVYPLNPDGSRMKPLCAEDGVIRFRGEGTMFFEIEA